MGMPVACNASIMATPWQHDVNVTAILWQFGGCMAMRMPHASSHDDGSAMAVLRQRDANALAMLWQHDDNAMATLRQHYGNVMAK